MQPMPRRQASPAYADDVVSDAAWKDLEGQLDRRQLLDLLITTGGYRMVSMALNTFGVPLEPNSERLPRSSPSRRKRLAGAPRSDKRPQRSLV
jgi:hypothetical protein